MSVPTEISRRPYLLLHKEPFKLKQWEITLLILNIITITAHLVCAAFIFTAKKDWKAPTTIDWSDWIPSDPNVGCMEDLLNGEKNICTMTIKSELLFKISIRTESGMFHMLSFIFELFPIIIDWRTYLRNAKNGKNQWRWVEYSCSASLMIMVIAQVNGITSAWPQLLLVVSTAAVMLLGLVGENEHLTGRSSNQKWLIHLTAWLLYVGVWVVIIWNFELTMTRQTHAAAKPPKIVKYIIWVTFLFFSSFGVVQTLQFLNIFHGKQWMAEVIYVSLSIGSKLTLGVMLFHGGAIRDGYVQ